MTQIHYTPEKVEEWRKDMEEHGDPEVDVYFHEDDETLEDESDKDSDLEGDEPQEEAEVQEE